MPWTTPILPNLAGGGGNAQALLRAYNVNQLTQASAYATWNPTSDITTIANGSQEMDVSQWDVTIPGGGSAVSNIKLSLEGRDGSMPGTWDIYAFAWAGGQAKELGTLAGSWQTKSYTGTPANWGLTAGDINNLVSNSSSYGFSVYLSPWSPTPGSFYFTTFDWVRIRNIELSFEYGEGSDGGILLAV